MVKLGLQLIDSRSEVCLIPAESEGVVSGVLMPHYHVTHVTLRDLRNALQPVRSDCGVVAVASIEGRPSKTITRSARYVA